MTEFWWLDRLGPNPPHRSFYVLQRVDRYLHKHPLLRPIRAPIPFAVTYRQGDPIFHYLIVGKSLQVVSYDHRGGQAGGIKSFTEWVRGFTNPTTRREHARRALENFHNLLAVYVFPAE